MTTVERKTTYKTGLAKVAVPCSADTFVVKIATFAKPENVSANAKDNHKLHSVKNKMERLLNLFTNFKSNLKDKLKEI